MTGGQPIYGPHGPIGQGEPGGHREPGRHGARVPADPWVRLGARLLDQLVLFIVYGLVVVLGALISGGAALFLVDPLAGADPIDGGVVQAWVIFVIVLCVIIGPLYFALWEAASGQTPGKMALGLHVVDSSGGRPRFLPALARNLFMLVAVFLVLPWLGAVLFYVMTVAVGFWIGISIARHPEHRGAHERQLKLRVVRSVTR